MSSENQSPEPIWQPKQTPQGKKLSFSLDTRIIIVVLLLIIAGMLFVWRPWSEEPTNNDRVITVTGEAKVKAEPDEFIFSPSYQFKNANKDTALSELTKKSEAVTKKLKELGVADSKIKVDSDGYNYSDYYFDQNTKLNTYSLRLTVKVDNREFAQKIQDYLIITQPLGSVSPQASFSDSKRKELASKARDEATKDARSKADQSAQNLGFKIGKVKNIDDGAGRQSFGMFNGGAAELSLKDGGSTQDSLAVQPGEDDLTYSVTVVYFLK